MNKLKEKITALPEAPGVYLFKDADGKIIYIGKAKSLKKRVSSYFTRFLSSKTQMLVSKIIDLDYILTPSEAQARLLEASLIKDKQPHYNISLKDDKSFPMIKISDEEFPVISICRKRNIKSVNRDRYFGPYASARNLRQSLKALRRIFGFRSCKKMPKTSCLYCRLNLCPGPCSGKIKAKDYQEIISQISLFLESKYEELLYKLTKKMQEAASGKNFEEAAKIRDQINALSVFSQGRIHSTGLNELEGLKNLLKLKKIPERIEGFDISNISGSLATGSMVSFYKGLPDKNNYRRYRIKLIKKVDDYGMIREVISRRYRRVKEEKLALPDLILIDGGRAHLLTALEEIKKLGLSVPLISIAKPRKEAHGFIRGRDKENIYTDKRAKPIKFSSDTPALNLIRRIRDEAHRFALAYHHILRRKKIIGK